MLRQILENENEPSTGRVYRWVMLVLILALMGWTIQIQIVAVEFSWPDLRRGLVVPVMLLFNHLAFAFRWPKSIGVALKVLAIFWLTIGGYLIFSELLTSRN